MIKKKIKKVAIVHAIHDGVTSMYTGVGRIAQNIIWGFPEIEKNLRKRINPHLFLITPDYPRSCSAYNKSFLQVASKITSRYHGKIFFIPMPKSCITANQIWGGINRWKQLGRKAAEIVDDLAKDYDLVIFFHHDISFAAANFNLRNRDKIISLWVPHSSSLIHHYGKLDRTRLKLEKKVAECINNQPNTFAAAIGAFMRNHLISDYKIKKEKIIDFKNGIINSLYTQYSHREAGRILNKYDIPANKPLILFWGRCIRHKGLDLILAAIKKINDKDFYFVNICPIETSSTEFIKKIKKESGEIEHKAKTIFNFDNQLSFAVMSHLNTRIILIPSRSDPCPLTVMEAKLYSKKTPFVIITSEIDGLVEQYIPNGMMLTKLNKEDLSKTIKKALSLSADKRRKMSRLAYGDLKNWDFIKNHIIGIKDVLDKYK